MNLAVSIFVVLAATIFGMLKCIRFWFSNSLPSVFSFYCVNVNMSISFFTECRGQTDNVRQSTRNLIAVEGQFATLSCEYNASNTNVYLFWYQQKANGIPEFILSKFSFGSGNNAFEGKYNATLDTRSRSTTLRIQNLEPLDSALYYCALEPTVTGSLDTLYKNPDIVRGRGLTCLTHSNT